MYDPKPNVLTAVIVFVRFQGVIRYSLHHVIISTGFQSESIFPLEPVFFQPDLFERDFKRGGKLEGHSKGQDSWRKKEQMHNLIQRNSDQSSCPWSTENFT